MTARRNIIKPKPPAIIADEIARQQRIGRIHEKIEKHKAAHVRWLKKLTRANNEVKKHFQKLCYYGRKLTKEKQS